MAILQSSVGDHTFGELVLASTQPVLVHFWAPWCGICKLIQPMLEDFLARHPEELKLLGVNADDNLRLASTYRLKMLPTLLLFQQGEVVFRQDTFRGRDDLHTALEQMTRQYISQGLTVRCQPTRWA